MIIHLILENVSADGEVGIEGKVSGVYNESRLPDININAMISNGYLAYQEYPLPIEKVQLEAALVIPGVNMDLTVFFNASLFDAGGGSRFPGPNGV